jgi:protein-tyrosine phosphatase
MSGMTRVWERLYLGSKNDAERLKLNSRGINTVISVCEEKLDRHNRKINYLHLPVAEGKAISVGQFDAIIDAISENIRWGTVLIHCRFGMLRAPILTAAYMHAVGYKHIDAALDDIVELTLIGRLPSILLDSVKEHLK